MRLGYFREVLGSDDVEDWPPSSSTMAQGRDNFRLAYETVERAGLLSFWDDDPIPQLSKRRYRNAIAYGAGFENDAVMEFDRDTLVAICDHLGVRVTSGPRRELRAKIAGQCAFDYDESEDRAFRRSELAAIAMRVARERCCR